MALRGGFLIPLCMTRQDMKNLTYIAGTSLLNAKWYTCTHGRQIGRYTHIRLCISSLMRNIHMYIRVTASPRDASIADQLQDRLYTFHHLPACRCPFAGRTPPSGTLSLSLSRVPSDRPGPFHNTYIMHALRTLNPRLKS